MFPDLESLRCFVQAATLHNFRVAARSVALSPSAFGGRIRRLEESLGAPLFQRTTRKVVLTTEGERLLPQARRCLEEAMRCVSTVRSDEKASYDLVIGTRFEVGLRWIVPALAQLESAHPERRLHLYFGTTEDMLPRLLTDEVNCMITSSRISTPNLNFARLLEEQVVFVASTELLAKTPHSRPEHARRHILLDKTRDLPLFRYFLDARPTEEVWVFDRVQYLGGIAAIKTRVLEGAGVAVLPLFYVRQALARGTLKQLFPKTQLPPDWLRMVWRNGCTHIPGPGCLAMKVCCMPSLGCRRNVSRLPLG
jgi:DNA-binding transcriptional LysR family regulator